MSELFAASYRFGPDVAALESATPAHVDHLSALSEQGRLLCSGPVGDPYAGALLLLRAEDLEAAEAMVAQDAYCARGLVTDVRVEAWTPMLGARRGLFEEIR